MRIGLILAVSCLLFGTALGADEPQDQVCYQGFDGMVLLKDTPTKTVYVVCHDRKDRPKDRPLSWLGLLTWEKDKGTRWEPLRVTVPEGQDPPSDLETCCRVPGREDLILTAESGYWSRSGPVKYGRVILFRLPDDPLSRDLEWVRSYRPFPVPEKPTVKHDQVEGMECVRIGENGLALVFVTVGEAGERATIRWGKLDLDASADADVYDERGTCHLTPGDGPLNARACGGAYIKKPNEDVPERAVWCSATYDPGDEGPFESIVYRAGTLRRVAGPKLFEYGALAKPVLRWRLDGVKVEAIAEAPSGIPNAICAVATDDEDYVGIWRVLHEGR